MKINSLSVTVGETVSVPGDYSSVKVSATASCELEDGDDIRECTLSLYKQARINFLGVFRLVWNGVHRREIVKDIDKWVANELKILKK